MEISPTQWFSLCFPMAVITTPCNTSSGCSTGLGHGPRAASRRRGSSPGASRASQPGDDGVYHKGSTSAAGKKCLPSAPRCGCFPRGHQWSCGGGAHACQSSAHVSTAELCCGTAGSSESSAQPSAPCWIGARISAGTPCSRSTTRVWAPDLRGCKIQSREWKLCSTSVPPCVRGTDIRKSHQSSPTRIASKKECLEHAASLKALILSLNLSFPPAFSFFPIKASLSMKRVMTFKAKAFP